MKSTALAALAMTTLIACGPPSTRFISPSDVKWEQLNPKRGDRSPKAGPLWGKRTGPGPAGFLLWPVDGFSSPPHIHNVDYHGVVITGTVHNADPSAAEFYMPPGSFWTQPGKGLHITACKGQCLAYIEVADKFEVLPASRAQKDIAPAINLGPSKIKWIKPADIPPAAVYGVRVAYPMGKPEIGQAGATLLKLPAGSHGVWHQFHYTYHAVVIRGRPTHRAGGSNKTRTMDPGTYFGSKGNYSYELSCPGKDECMVYIRTKGPPRFWPVKQ